MSYADATSLQSVVRQFQRAERDFTVRPFGTGHIHDTFLVRSDNNSQYLLQRINHAVYQDVAGLMQNIQRVTSHLRQKLDTSTSDSLTTFCVIPTHDQHWFYQDEAGHHWRMFTFVDRTVAYEVAQSPELIRKAGQAFGQFIALLRDLPGEPLITTIPAFHNMGSRLRNFERTVSDDTVGRLAQVSPEVAFVRQRADEMRALHQRVADGKIPQRTTHNDTKLSNVLFDRSGEARCVVDLDTVMPGTVLYDFGDAIRSMASTTVEDEGDLDQVRFHFPFYEAFAEGFLSDTRSFLTEAEIDQLPFSACYMTFIMGVRFLTDYLAGDVYYKIRDPAQNLRRARNQFQLIRRMEDQYDEMIRVVQRLT